MFIKNLLKLLALLVILILAGCATSQSYIDMRTTPGQFFPDENTKQIYVRTIKDLRIFEEKPATPDIPSLKGGLKKAKEDTKIRAIGRKRNSFGKALGDVLLTEGQTVNTIIYDTLVKAFNNLGYSVTNKQEEVKPDAIILDVNINKCWSWIEIGMWIVEINSEVATELRMELPDQNIDEDINVIASNKAAVVVTGTYQAVIQLALNRYQAKVEKEFAAMKVEREATDIL